ncbi:MULTISPECIES: thioredoxin-dependent thiol peroxidase [Bacillus amyloliquefaciens group]|uniref:thioredoxin-dependent thiol peroxidase n=1 Tax=Bacillus amyloliquefaciens group TaxID=1938374 RepID=UPI00038739EE|nr:thioredoxin-dependent thiol peroxidase [Bacillus velezensis]MBC2599990.1 thioredoxin-dependent thiol peroxidase [Bacillus velezensis]MBU5241460.1 thioredoxin-dependent thiol peroxidase [Bacillus velezensis]MCM3372791.1 thioredoxin-dependent thiol peroxidase [Bacillus velezensis]MED3703857.1 thioredoxin-dependent thiol peroxidase [Bacillus velezensis]MED4704993.1 thioredoxin-dependent thiol peroxidase [Bacillus velezensis]
MTIEIGQTAPDMKLVNDSGEEVALTDFKGKYVVLYFYPKDMTPGCTTEACDFRDQHESFAGLDAVIIGVSPDSRDKHEKFKQKHDLPFQLLVDDEHKLAEAFDVWKLKKNFGKEYMGIERSTFLLDKEGCLVKEWRKVKVKDHVAEALRELEQIASN